MDKLLKLSIIQWVISTLIYLYFLAVVKTSKVTFINKTLLEETLKHTNGAIVVFWHNQVLIYPNIFLRLEQLYMIIFRSKHGKIIGKTARYFSSKPIWGSSHKGAKAAFHNAIRILEGGNIVGFTPDGPKGPPYHLKKGCILAAAKTNKPIIFYAVTLRKKKIVSNWDKTIIPLPFNDFVCLWGEPYFVTKDVLNSEEILEMERQNVETRLNNLNEEIKSYLIPHA